MTAAILRKRSTNLIDWHVLNERQAAPAAPAELTDGQIAATAGRLGGISESRPLGQQWDSVYALVRKVIQERCAVAVAPAWADQAVIEYRYTGGTHWCPLGSAERMRPDFDGVCRLQAGRFPVTAPQDQQPGAAEVEPIDMVLHCPACGLQHIDAPEPELGPSVDGSGDMPIWSNPPHRSHLCHGCGHIWRPADVPTNGVASVKTMGRADSPIAARAGAQDSVSIEECANAAGTKRAPLFAALKTLGYDMTLNQRFDPRPVLGEALAALNDRAGAQAVPSEAKAVPLREAVRKITDLASKYASICANNPERVNQSWLNLVRLVEEIVAAAAAPAAVSAPADPMDWPLPCDVTVGHGTIGKGVPLRTLVNRMKVLYCMATGNDADEVANRTPEQNQALTAAFVASVQAAAPQAPARAPLTDGKAKAVLWSEHLRWMKAAGLDTEGMLPTADWLENWLPYVRAIEAAHGITGATDA